MTEYGVIAQTLATAEITAVKAVLPVAAIAMLLALAVWALMEVRR